MTYSTTSLWNNTERRLLLLLPLLIASSFSRAHKHHHDSAAPSLSLSLSLATRARAHTLSPVEIVLAAMTSKRVMSAVNIVKSAVFKKKKKKVEKTKRKKKALLPGMIEGFNKGLLKYWLRRSSLFSRFDDGVKCDEQGLFSVTPEEIAKHQALRCGSGGIVVDAFTGVGGNAIQFACRQNEVIAIDINPRRIKCARHNAKVYGVAHRIDFIVGDFFGLAPSLKADIVFLSPPWGGPDYKKAETYDIETMLQPKDGFSLFSAALSVAPSVVLFLPRTVDMEQLEQLAWLSNPPLTYKVEKNHVNGYLKAVTVYYGKVANQEAS